MAGADSGAAGDAVSPRESIVVELAHCVAPREVRCMTLHLPAGSTVRDALEACGWFGADTDWAALRLGIWNHKAGADRVLHGGERVEVYRPLLADPKESRRLRYNAQHTRPGQACGPGGPNRRRRGGG